MKYPRSRFDRKGASFRSRLVFIDRKSDIGYFKNLLDQLENADILVVWNIYGAPGIGKTRLAAELHRLAVQRPRKKLAAIELSDSRGMRLLSLPAPPVGKRSEWIS